MKHILFHCEVAIVGRASGQNACNKAAYNAAERIRDLRTGEIFDYTHKKSVLRTRIVMPAERGVRLDREELWNRVERRERCRDSRLAREFRVSLPHALSRARKWNLTLRCAQFLADELETPVDAAFHKASRANGDRRNDHAHLLAATRKFNGAEFTVKHRHLDNPRTSGPHIRHIRATIAGFTNEALKEAGLALAVDHRSYAAQGITRIPGRHLGPAKFWQQTKLLNELKVLEEELEKETAKQKRKEKRKVTEAMARSRGLDGIKAKSKARRKGQPKGRNPAEVGSSTNGFHQVPESEIATAAPLGIKIPEGSNEPALPTTATRMPDYDPEHIIKWLGEANSLVSAGQDLSSMSPDARAAVEIKPATWMRRIWVRDGKVERFLPVLVGGKQVAEPHPNAGRVGLTEAALERLVVVIRRHEQVIDDPKSPRIEVIISRERLAAHREALATAENSLNPRREPVLEIEHAVKRCIHDRIYPE